MADHLANAPLAGRIAEGLPVPGDIFSQMADLVSLEVENLQNVAGRQSGDVPCVEVCVLITSWTLDHVSPLFLVGTGLPAYRGAQSSRCGSDQAARAFAREQPRTAQCSAPLSGTHPVLYILAETIPEDARQLRQAAVECCLAGGVPLHQRPLTLVDDANAPQHPLSVTRGAGTIAPVASHCWVFVAPARVLFGDPEIEIQ